MDSTEQASRLLIHISKPSENWGRKAKGAKSSRLDKPARPPDTLHPKYFKQRKDGFL